MQGHCMRCKTSREMKDTQQVTMKNGGNAMKGVCATCGCKMFAIMKKDSSGAMPKAA